MNRISSIIFLLLCAFLVSCGQQPSKNDYVITIKTSYGDMVAVLHDETPKHKENFIKLAKEKFFDSLIFHRVISGFMIQGGDPSSKKALAGQTVGMGGPGYTIDAEFNPAFFHKKGALAAARIGDQMNPTKASSGSQFYIVQGQVWKEADLRIDQQKLGMALQQFLTIPANKALYDSVVLLYQTDMKLYEEKIFSLAPRIQKEMNVSVIKDFPADRLEAYTTVGGAPHLDDEYTVFGQVIQGLDVIDKIVALPRTMENRPLEDVRMFVTVEEMPRKKITKLYGYEYPEIKK